MNNKQEVVYNSFIAGLESSAQVIEVSADMVEQSLATANISTKSLGFKL